MSEEEDWYKKLTGSHFLAVGKATTEWGELEMLIYRYLEWEIPSEGLYKFLVKNMRGFEGRCDLLLHMVRAKVADESRTPDLKRALDTAKNLSRTRNLMAHNPMKFWINDSEIKGEIIHSKNNEETGLDLTAVTDFINSTHEIRHEIMRAMIKATGRCE